MIARLARRPLLWFALVALALGAATGLYWFQPWKLVTDTAVADAVPDAVPVVTVPSPGTASPTGSPSPSVGSSGVPGNRLLADGTFITHEHATTGTVQLVRLADGRRQLVLRDLATSNGPDLRVWLTDQPVKKGVAGWRVFDDGRHHEVSRLRGNRGSQVYDLPPALDLDEYRSVTIWCKRFAVSFGAAELATA